MPGVHTEPADEAVDEDDDEGVEDGDSPLAQPAMTTRSAPTQAAHVRRIFMRKR